MIDTTINMGHIIQFFVMVCGGAWFLWELRTRLALLDSNVTLSHRRLDKIDMDIEGLSKIAVQIALQEARMNVQDQRLNEISTRVHEQISKFADAVQTMIVADRVSQVVVRKKPR